MGIRKLIDLQLPFSEEEWQQLDFFKGIFNQKDYADPLAFLSKKIPLFFS